MAVLAETLSAPVADRRRFQVAIGGSRLVSLLGFAVLAAAWLGTAHLTRIEDQIPWLAVALVGLALAGGAPVWALTGQRRAVAIRLAEVTDLLELHTGGAGETVAGDVDPGDDLVASPSMVRYHRPSCPLAAGKRVAPASRSVHATAGRQPCGVCEP
jgi:hypothetical protein